MSQMPPLRSSRPGGTGSAACEELLAIAAHELRTPLCCLTLQLSLARRMVERQPADGEGHGLAGPLMELLLGCERQARRVNDLVTILLDVTRLRSGQVALRPEEVDLAALVRDAVARLGPELAQAGCTVNVRGEERVPGRWDRLRLDQVLTNLLSNALKYGAGRPIELAVGARGDRAYLTVRDHGEGMSAEEQAHIFERFGRCERHRERPGIGLGLYIVRTILEAMGGSIRVASELGTGTTFLVEVPRGVLTP